MQLVMFDIDGTLTESNDLDEEAFLEALFELFGFSEVSNDWTSYRHVTDAYIFKEVFCNQLGRIPTVDEVARFQNRLLELLKAKTIEMGGIQPISGAAGILAQLIASSNHCLAYAGGAWTASSIFKLQCANLPIQNVPYAFSDDAESREEIMSIALARAEEYYGQTFSNVVYVGDGIWDVRSAKKSEFSFVGIASGAQAETLHSEGATYVFPNYDDRFLAALAAMA